MRRRGWCALARQARGKLALAISLVSAAWYCRPITARKTLQPYPPCRRPRRPKTTTKRPGPEATSAPLRRQDRRSTPLPWLRRAPGPSTAPWRSKTPRRCSSCTPAPASAAIDHAYGGHFWLVPSTRTDVPATAFATSGNRGQYVIILPEKDLVIVRRGLDWGRQGFDRWDLLREVLKAF